MPGVDNALLATDIAAAAAYVAQALAYPHVPAEPPLRCYVTATCPVATPHVSCRLQRVLIVPIPARMRAVSSATLDGRVLHVRRRGRRRVLMVDLRGLSQGRAVLIILGRDRRGHVLREVRRFRRCVPSRAAVREASTRPSAEKVGRAASEVTLSSQTVGKAYP